MSSVDDGSGTSQGRKSYRGKYVLDEPPVSCQPTLADMLGLNEAILIQELHWLSNVYPIAHNPKTGRLERLETHEHDGLNFVRVEPQQLLDKVAGRLRFWSHSTLKRVIASCRTIGILRIDTFNRDGWDQTNWYAVDLDAIYALEQQHSRTRSQIDPMHQATGQVDVVHPVNLTAAPSQNDTINRAKMTRSRKDRNKTENSKNNSNSCAPQATAPSAPAASVAVVDQFSEDERRAAWEAYAATQTNLPVPARFVNGMMKKTGEWPEPPAVAEVVRTPDSEIWHAEHKPRNPEVALKHIAAIIAAGKDMNQ